MKMSEAGHQIGKIARQGAREDQEAVRTGSGMSNFQDYLRRVCGTDDPLTLILRGGDVVRYHTEGRAVPRQTVAEHTWRMMVILDRLWPGARYEHLLLAALYHDVSEGIRGDPPVYLTGLIEFNRKIDEQFHTHANVPCTEWSLSNSDLARLKCADYLEALIFAGSQNTRGAKAIVRRAEELVRACITKLPADEQPRVEGFLNQVLENIRG